MLRIDVRRFACASNSQIPPQTPSGSLAMQPELVRLGISQGLPHGNLAHCKMWLLIARMVLLRTALPPKRGKH